MTTLRFIRSSPPLHITPWPVHILLTAFSVRSVSGNKLAQTLT
ncbi:hypothetical protein BOO71_0007609 [Deinococcus marmoris]|uniref:Uncharacterized protein n=1 Tax=Deinococcus marmoris TaxID=249408 RepID=A0A1U7NY65_9DEIO|nr:hypothetical protein BOO71_0007609 [Deinococcus marmoris]